MAVTETFEMGNSSRWSRGDLETVARCPACGSNDRHTMAFERRDNEASLLDRWRMVRCADCNSVWLNPRPDATSLSRAYDNYYTHDAESEDIPQVGASGFAWRVIHSYLNGRFGMHRRPAARLGGAVFSLIEPWRLKLDYYGRHLTKSRFPQPGRLLDIGCGNGAFLVRAKDMGWHAQGCEIDPKAVAACRDVGIDVVEGDAFHPSLKERTFDVITMSHVIEHVVDQQSLLRRVYDLLRPGGWCWMALPNPQSIGLLVFGAGWHALHPPYHLCIPSQSILRSWMHDSGFVDLRFLRRGAHARRVWRLSRAIARRESLPIPSRGMLHAWRLIADTLATVSPRWAEETVMFARNPAGNDGI